jgi:hypothetical protein
MKFHLKACRSDISSYFGLDSESKRARTCETDSFDEPALKIQKKISRGSFLKKLCSSCRSESYRTQLRSLTKVQSQALFLTVNDREIL